MGKAMQHDLVPLWIPLSALQPQSVEAPAQYTQAVCLLLLCCCSCTVLLLCLQISTVNMGLAVGWSAVVLGYGKKGLRKSLPHSLGELQGATEQLQQQLAAAVVLAALQPDWLFAVMAAATTAAGLWHDYRFLGAVQPYHQQLRL